jgi:hypothetical protein
MAAELITKLSHTLEHLAILIPDGDPQNFLFTPASLPYLTEFTVYPSSLSTTAFDHVSDAYETDAVLLRAQEIARLPRFGASISSANLPSSSTSSPSRHHG